MTTLTEYVHTGEFLVSEANNTLSREQVELAPSLSLFSGTVLRKNTSTDVYTPLIPNGRRTFCITMLLPMPRAVKWY